ncbi:bifunctional UDP-sugar hydrolase/5'-nucleotidase [Jeotgalibacillus sp. ET6]|uniref:bifunctional metallophosphatase/5'-nucleotidase n=1 Tax=Jeotgalibacillus sp. ET6 TaxID=3037260 RepID=UPI0024181917|nr:bifunctional UDP-sugar hydrolase/5'-nucleotidase [Jeotgalibacillus sp. ET6]MDG5471545.1 bifunctional UDP-sugar hydrolase/5'-nucleotidase [Jeotgalibacillus sp. ET6]
MKAGCKAFLVLLLAFSISFSAFTGSSDALSDKAPGKDEKITGMVFLKELVTTLGIDLQTPEELPFDDVSAADEPYIDAAIRVGILDEKMIEEFGPNEKITKEQAYVFLVRSLNLRDYYSVRHLFSYKDFRAIKPAYIKEMSAAAALGLIETHKRNTIQPKKPLTSNELADLMETFDSSFEMMPIIHTNDFHGRILHNEELGEMGLAKVAQIVDDVRDHDPGAFLFDMGDTLHGTAVVNNFNGEPAIEAMNEIGFDAMVPGNHDFNYGNEYLLEAAEEMNFPLVSGNILKNGDPYLDEYIVLERDGKKFGVIGMTATDTAVKTSPKNLEGIVFEDELTRTQEIVDAIEDEVDHIILLSHSGLGTDEMIADEVEGVDLILGGHSHDTIETPVKYDEAYITQAFEYGKALGHTNLVFHEDELIGVNGFLYRDNPSVEGKSDINDIIQPYKDEVDELLNVVIGTTDVKLEGDRRLVRTQETNLGNLIADSMRTTLGSDIAFTNGGGIRASIEAGEVTRGDVEEVLPFVNTLVQMKVDGAAIKAALEHSVRLAPAENGGFLHISGMSFTYDPSLAAGSRVKEVLVGEEPLDETKEYTVATNDFTAIGGDGYTMFGEEFIEYNSGELLSAILIEAISSGQEIPEVEGRIIAE